MLAILFLTLLAERGVIKLITAVSQRTSFMIIFSGMPLKICGKVVNEVLNMMQFRNPEGAISSSVWNQNNESSEMSLKPHYSRCGSNGNNVYLSTYPFCGCFTLARPWELGVLSLGEYATGLIAGPELAVPAPAPPAVNGLAILLMVVLGAKEYFGGTEAGASESYEGVGEGDNAAQHTTCSYTFWQWKFLCGCTIPNFI